MSWYIQENEERIKVNGKVEIVVRQRLVAINQGINVSSFASWRFSSTVEQGPLEIHTGLNHNSHHFFGIRSDAVCCIPNRARTGIKT